MTSSRKIDTNIGAEEVLSVWNKWKTLPFSVGVRDFQSNVLLLSLCYSNMRIVIKHLRCNPSWILMSNISIEKVSDSPGWTMTQSQRSCSFAIRMVSHMHRQIVYILFIRHTLSEDEKGLMLHSLVGLCYLSKESHTNMASFLTKFFPIGYLP